MYKGTTEKDTDGETTDETTEVKRDICMIPPAVNKMEPARILVLRPRRS
jgi:hypothetical protein